MQTDKVFTFRQKFAVGKGNVNLETAGMTSKQRRDYYRLRSAARYGAEQAVIREFRQYHGWTAKQMGEMLNTSGTLIIDYEHGYCQANWKLLAKIGCTKDWRPPDDDV